jgi:TetR/AcrR family transcriptional regulator, hemagglutinin/protease regulatory protein
MACALAAFAEHGVARATHSHVAERAGVSVSTVHAYFRTREDLVAAVLTDVETYLLRTVSEALGGDKTVFEALTTSAVNFSQCALTDPDRIKVWLDWSTGVRADVWPRYLDLLATLQGFAEAVFVRGKVTGQVSPALDVKAAARLYIGGGHTVALMMFSGATPDDRAALIDHLVRSIIDLGPA